MPPLFFVFFALTVVAQLALPRKWAFLPLLVAGCHLPNSEIALSLTPVRILVAIGMIRAYSGGFLEFKPKVNTLDKIFVIFAVLFLLSSVGHRWDNQNPLVGRIGAVWNILGTYIYGRSYLPDLDGFKRFVRIIPWVLAPLAFFMVIEKGSGKNSYSAIGARLGDSIIRDGKIRAAGPFRHPILAGTCGASALPFMYLLWRERRRTLALLGAGSGLLITVSTASSGPLATVGVAFGGFMLWRFRKKMNLIRWGAVAFGALFWITRGKGPWYIMAMMDLVGGSTGWHRAKLMDQAYIYLDEWWLFGTDYTRHWMTTGVSWSPDHVDITNYYLYLGVMGGLPAMICLVIMIKRALWGLGDAMAEVRDSDPEYEVTLWAMGTVIMAHAVSFVSISYFDQMFVMFYLALALSQALVTSVPRPAEDPELKEV